MLEKGVYREHLLFSIPGLASSISEEDSWMCREWEQHRRRQTRVLVCFKAISLPPNSKWPCSKPQARWLNCSPVVEPLLIPPHPSSFDTLLELQQISSPSLLGQGPAGSLSLLHSYAFKRWCTLLLHALLFQKPLGWKGILYTEIDIANTMDGVEDKRVQTPVGHPNVGGDLKESQRFFLNILKKILRNSSSSNYCYWFRLAAPCNIEISC